MNQSTLPYRSEPAADPVDALLDAHMTGHAEELAPSSGFVLAVMDSVRAESNELPPLAFPWRRVLPGVAAILCGLIALVVFSVRMAARATQHLDGPLAITYKPNFTPTEAAFAWILLTACVSMAVIAASVRLTSCG